MPAVEPPQKPLTPRVSASAKRASGLPPRPSSSRASPAIWSGAQFETLDPVGDAPAGIEQHERVRVHDRAVRLQRRFDPEPPFESPHRCGVSRRQRPPRRVRAEERTVACQGSDRVVLGIERDLRQPQFVRSRRRLQRCELRGHERTFVRQRAARVDEPDCRGHAACLAQHDAVPALVAKDHRRHRFARR